MVLGLSKLLLRARITTRLIPGILSHRGNGNVASHVCSAHCLEISTGRTLATTAVGMSKKGILERLAEGPVIGDGSYCVTLEKRGYVKGGPFTPECVVQYPDAVRQLHRDFAHAGCDVLQAFTFYSTDAKLDLSEQGKSYTAAELNQAACDIVYEIAKEYEDKSDLLICGGLSPTPAYIHGKGKKVVQAEFQVQLDVFKKNKVDFLLGEFFGHLEEAIWCIEEMKKMDVPVACTLRIGPVGDINGKTVEECAVEMVKAGADIIGLNCAFDYNSELKAIAAMKAALEKEGLKAHLMLQPVGYHVPETEKNVIGYFDLPEYPFALEPRIYTRWDIRDYARRAYDLGVRYIGGCCGFEPYHIREISEELKAERGGRSYPGSKMSGNWGEGMKESTISPHTPTRNTKDYWSKVVPASGRPGGRLTNDPVKY